MQKLSLETKEELRKKIKIAVQFCMEDEYDDYTGYEIPVFNKSMFDDILVEILNDKSRLDIEDIYLD